MILHYAANNPVDPKYQDQSCRVLVWSRKNVLVETGIGLVVVPRRNLRKVRT
jgi:hypothetical protein